MLRLLIFLIASVCPLAARTFTIEGAVERARAANPDLAAARLGIEQARARVMQSGRQANPELEVEVKPNLAGREFTFSAGFVQRFPLTKKLWHERAVSEAELRAAEAEVRNAARLLAAEVRTASVKLLALKAQQALLEKQRANSQELASAAAKTAEAGEGSTLDSAHFDLEAQQFSLELMQLETGRAALTGELHALLALPPEEPLFIPGELAEPTAASGSANPAQRPDYQAAQAKEDAARAGIDFAKAGKWDDATYGLAYERSHIDDAGEGMERDNSIGFKFSLPLPLRNKNEGKVAEANATAARAQQEREALAARIRAEAATAAAEMAIAEKIHAQTHGGLLQKAIELEERHLAASKLGQVPMTDVLRARERRFELEKTHLNAVRDWHLARIRLLAAQGR
jgi:outer membrane protein TolC